ncbi:MAG: PAS domain S-box protein [Planctomycetota bacterium]|nr:PAS domain S-box protein [Planctomycetota bacterium]
MVDGAKSGGSQQSRVSRSGDSLLRLAFDTAATPMVCLDENRQCWAINHACTELLGLDEASPLVAWKEMVSVADAERVDDWLSGLQGLQGEVSTDFEFRLNRKLGNGIAICGRAHVELDDQGRVRGYVIAFTEAKLAKNVTAENRSEAEHRLFDLIASEFEVSKGLEHVVRFVEQQASDVMASIDLFNQAENKLQHAAAPSLSSELMEAVTHLPIAERILAKPEVSERRKMIVVKDIESDPMWANLRTLARRECVGSHWVLPILDARGSLLGTLAIFQADSGIPTTEYLNLMDSAAKVISVLLASVPDSQELNHDREEQLRRTQFSIERCSTSVFWLRKNGSFVYANEAALELFRYSRDELLAKRFFDLETSVCEESWSKFLNRLKEQETITYQTSMQDKDGDAIPVDVAANYFVSDGQELIVTFVSDVSYKNELYENSPHMLLSIDARTGRIQQCNATMVRLLGRSKIDLLQNRVFDLFTAASHDRLHDEVFPAFLETGEVKDEEVQIVCADGSIRDVIFGMTPMRGEAGKTVAACAVMRDITEQKRTQSRLAESESLFRNLAGTSSFGVQRNDVYGRITFANAVLGQIYGCPPEVLVGTSVFDFAINEQMRREMRGQLKQQLEDPLSTPPTYEMVHRTMDGRVVDLRIDWTVDRGVDGSVVGFIVVVTDITERKRAERELAFRADVLDRVSDAIIVTDQRGNVNYASEAARQFYHADDLAGREWMLADRHRQLLAAADFDDDVRVILGELGAWHGEHELTFEGRAYWLEITLKSFPSPSSGKRLLLTVIRDISSRRLSEQENRRHRDLLAHVARLSTMGALVAGIAHEVKQPLYAISNYSTAVSVALKRIGETVGGANDQLAELNEFNEGVQASAQKANEIIRRMRDFAKRGLGERAPVDLNQVAIDSVNLLSFKARDSRVDVQLKLVDGLPSVVADRIQCEQVVVNLLGNAYEALESINGPRVVVILTRFDSTWVELEVQDNGPGIKSADMGCLFDPFYTTKKDGMGMGLAISETIIADHGGRLVARHGEVGTVFSLSMRHAGSRP